MTEKRNRNQITMKNPRYHARRGKRISHETTSWRKRGPAHKADLNHPHNSTEKKNRNQITMNHIRYHVSDRPMTIPINPTGGTPRRHVYLVHVFGLYPHGRATHARCSLLMPVSGSVGSRAHASRCLVQTHYKRSKQQHYMGGTAAAVVAVL